MERLEVCMMLLQGNYQKIEPASASIIMAVGIFLISSIEAFPFLNIYFGKLSVFILLIYWLVIYGLLTIQFFHHDFLIPFIKDPINSFAIGTWIAGVSVLCNVFIQYFPSIMKITQIIALVNTLLWLLFFIMCLYNFKKLLFDKHDHSVHGIVLLSTVGTQSVVVLVNNVFLIQNIVSEIIIISGLVFYVVGIFLITTWIARESDWRITDDWSNTNCIIHGGLSITGLAILTTNTFTPEMVNLLWIITFMFLIIVESVELLRAKRRVKEYGWNKGIFNYHVSQWSRNFTFGMFYFFTFMIHNNPNYFLSVNLNNFQESIAGIWAWVVLITLIIEIIIYLKHFMNPTVLLVKKRI